MLISSIVVFAQCFDFVVFKDDADESSSSTVFAATDDVKSIVFEIFSSLDENEANENRYSCSESFSITRLNDFFASRLIIESVDTSFHDSFSLFDSMFTIFVKSLCDMSSVSLVRKDSLMS